MNIIHVKRRPYQGRVPANIMMESVWKIGGSLDKHGNLLKGISSEEEKKWLPEVTGIYDVKSPDFSKEVKKYYSDMTVIVPMGGVKLNITTDAEGNPEVITDYLKYRYLMVHKKVAKTEEELSTNISADFYFLSIEDNIKKQNEKIQDAKKAAKEYIKVSENEEKLDQVIRLFSSKHNQRVEDLDRLEKENLAYEMSTKHPLQFYEICTDKSLETRSFLDELTTKGILTKIGNRYLNGDEILGDGTQEVVLYLQDKKNSGVLVTLKARLEASK